MSGHVFISHGSEDRDAATALSSFLEGHGVRTWIAPRDVRPGTDYSEALQAAIEGCTAFVVLVTATSNKSPYVRAETEMAFSTGKPIFPVRRSDIKPAAGLALFLKIRHWTDAFGKDEGQAMDRLALELQALTGAAPEPTVSPPPDEPVPPPPPPPPPPLPPPPPPADEARLSAAIGPKAAWYLERWRLADAKGSKVSWNWPACLVAFPWLLYRKMWLLAVFVGVAFFLLSAVGMIDQRLAMPTFLATIAITFVTGSLGSHWYRRQVNALAADPNLDLAALEKQGGVSVPAVWISVGITVALLLLSAALTMQRIEPPAPPPPAPPSPNGGGDKPLNGGDQPAPPPAATFDASYFVGRWSDEADCANPVEFFADGRWVTETGGGVWSFESNQMTLSGPGGSQVVNVVALDQNSFSLTTNQGQTSVSRRC